MNCLNSPVCILLIYQYRDLDLTGRDHIDVNVGIIQCLKQLAATPGLLIIPEPTTETLAISAFVSSLQNAVQPCGTLTALLPS